MRWYINLLLFLTALDSCLAQKTADTAANQKTRDILQYITNLPQQSLSSNNTSENRLSLFLQLLIF